MAKKVKVSAKTYQKYQREIVKLCLEFLVLSAVLSWAMIFVDSKKQEEQQVLGVRVRKEVRVQLSKEEECKLNYRKYCQNPATNYCVKLVKDCKEVVDLRNLGE